MDGMDAREGIEEDNKCSITLLLMMYVELHHSAFFVVLPSSPLTTCTITHLLALPSVCSSGHLAPISHYVLLLALDVTVSNTAYLI